MQPVEVIDNTAAYGVCKHMRDFPRQEVSAIGEHNDVFVMKAHEMPWVKNTFVLGVESRNLPVVVRRGKRFEMTARLCYELRFTSFLAFHGMAPNLYGAQLSYCFGEKRDARLTLIMQAYPHTLAAVLKRDPTGLSSAVMCCVKKVSLTGIVCMDIKPQNIVVSENFRNVRMIDFDPMYCGHSFLFRDDELDADQARMCDPMDLARKWRDENKMHFTAGSSSDCKMKEAVMVLMLRLHVCAFHGRSTFMRRELELMYNEKLHMLNDVPMQHYQDWYDNDTFKFQYMFVEYFQRSLPSDVKTVKQILSVAIGRKRKRDGDPGAKTRSVRKIQGRTKAKDRAES